MFKRKTSVPPYRTPLSYGLRAKIIGSLLLLLTSFTLRASETNIQDHNLKAVYLFRFAFLTSWGEFAPHNKQFHFCSETDLDTSNTLQTLINKKSAQAKYIPFSSVQDLEQENCHIVYLSAQSPNTIKQFTLSQPHALLIGDGKPFIAAGGMIAFIKVNNRIKPLISLNNIKPTELSLRSQLLSVSEIATDEVSP